MRHVRMLGIGLVVMLLGAAFASSTALANRSQGPGAEKFNLKWSKFRHCPVFEISASDKCFYAETNPEKKGGYYSVGPIVVNVTKSISLQGGLTEANEETNLAEVIAPTDGAAVIAPVAEKVPGEPLGSVSEAEMNEAAWPQALRESYEEAKKHHLLKEGKTTEIIEPAGNDTDYASTFNLLLGEGSAIEANVQITGKNAWLEALGGNCQIGSEADPIVQHLTSGESVSPLTGEVLKGNPGYPAVWDNDELVSDTETELVDNTYSVPGAEHCGGSANEAYLDPVVDHAFGIPAVAGASKTLLIGQLFQATRDSTITHYF
ncbi:MAG TPA: hypothetical protein VMB51_04180 [Solirubrobacteraceae bacterium]|nr:hypothetical protein [Solirubrobacteraceae bacterium]